MSQENGWRRRDGLGRSRDHALRASCLLYSRILFFCAVLVVLIVVLPTATASARTLSAEPSGGGLVENPDHTWTLYAYGHVIKVYSAAEKEIIDRVWHAEEFDLIPGRASGKEVTGISSAEAEAAAGLVNRLRTGKPYATAGEREVGEGYMRTVEEKGIIEKRAEALFGGLYEKTLVAGEPFAVAISTGIPSNGCSHCRNGLIRIWVVRRNTVNVEGCPSSISGHGIPSSKLSATFNPAPLSRSQAAVGSVHMRRSRSI